MKCERCGQHEAEVHIKQIVNGKVEEHHLCLACAREAGLPAGLGAKALELDLGGLLNTLWKDLLQDQSGPKLLSGGEEGEPPVCAECGHTLEEFKKTGKLGCPACYDGFREILQPLLRKIHGADFHRGLAPCASGWMESLEQRHGVLREELQEAVDREEYEQAARLRDEIRALERKMEEQS
ncbi:MAG: UvrB/UvrC motif-containing protein [Synergistales bacterium]|nr:UvrB/UvrC motif-containing protein [Synergistales bacterium]